MARKIPGLVRRGKYWHIDMYIRGYGRLCESTGETDPARAKQYLARRIVQIRDATIYGIRIPRTFREAAEKHLAEVRHQPSYDDQRRTLQTLMPHFGDLPIAQIDQAAVTAFANRRLAERIGPKDAKRPVSHRTINMTIELVIRILRKACDVWRDEFGMSWIDRVPRIRKLRESPTRIPHALSRAEQEALLALLAPIPRAIATFLMNTGCREQEACRLRWDYGRMSDDAGGLVFVIPPDFGGKRKGSGVKNRQPRTVVLNSVARAVVDHQRVRAASSLWVFPNPETSKPFDRLNGKTWANRRKEAAASLAAKAGIPRLSGLDTARVHDLKHTFGARLVASDVPYEARQLLLGHKPMSVTSHYSALSLARLVDYAERVVAPCEAQAYLAQAARDDVEEARRRERLARERGRRETREKARKAFVVDLAGRLAS